ncbi:MAG: DUF4340 domain-containing protein [Rhodothermales bacterium]|nr:DUF4340 domain-containing protein [Rhodothermales bacterium]
MQSNRIAQLIGVLAVLLGIAYLAGVFDSEPSTISVPDVDVPTEEVTGLRLQADTWEVALSRDGGVWRVTEPVSSLADSNTVSRLLNSIAELELNSVVSTNVDRHQRYGVDQETGRYLTLTWGDEEYRMVVAAEGPDFSTSYVRLNEEETVYTGSRIALPTSADQVRDKTLLNIPAELVQSASVETSEYAYQLAYADGWTISESAGPAVAADSMKVVSWLRRYSPLRFDGFEDELTPDSVDVSTTVSLTLQSGLTRTVHMGTRGSDILAYTDGSPQVMRAAITRLGFLIEEPDEIKAD